MFITENGLIKRTAFSEYGVRKPKFTAINLKPGDRLLTILPVNAETKSLMLVSRAGMVIHFPIGEIAAIGRVSAGIKGMLLAAEDHILAALPGSDVGELVLLSDQGYLKRCLMVEFEWQARAGKGVRAMNLLKNGANGKEIVAAFSVHEPFTFSIVQKDGTRTPVDTEAIKIEMRSGKGQPFVVVMGDNTVTGIER